MAKLIVSILSSLDGYCAGPGGALDKLPMGPAFDAHNLALMRGADAFVFGATTYPLFQSYWPAVDRGPEAEPIAREISERFETGLKVVISDTLAHTPDGPWAETEVTSRAHAEKRIVELKARCKGDLLIFGSARLSNHLMSKGLVDEFNLLVANVVLGDGVRAFEPGMTTSFRLLSQRQLPDSSIAALRYGCRKR